MARTSKYWSLLQKSWKESGKFTKQKLRKGRKGDLKKYLKIFKGSGKYATRLGFDRKEPAIIITQPIEIPKTKKDRKIFMKALRNAF